MAKFKVKTSEILRAGLKKQEDLKRDFVSSISHEFKTPITAIEGFARLLRNENLTAEQFDEYTEIIIKEAARLTNLSTNLLKLSVLDSSENSKLSAKTFYVDEQLRFTILLLERSWQEKNINFEINMEEILYTGDEDLLSQVWINILQNAIKFSPPGGTVAVCLRRQKSAILVEIADEGPGISDEIAAKIFDRFTKDVKHSPEGVGLGLAIAKRIVSICGGEISFKSNGGRTVFRVKLPLC